MDIMTRQNGFTPPLNNDQLRKYAPAIFADAPAEEVSDRYSFIPTIDVVEGLRNFGWLPVEAKQTRGQTQERMGIAKHMVKFQNPDVKERNGVAPEVIMTNSHDRSAAFNFMAGLFRFACSNGIIIADAMFGKVSVRHSVQAIDESVAACFSMLENVPAIMAAVERFQEIQLTPVQQEVFARSAAHFRYGVHSSAEDRPRVAYGGAYALIAEQRKAKQAGEDPEAVKYVPIKPIELLAAHRDEDSSEVMLRGHGYGPQRAKSDLWTTYNVIQENMLKGGISGRSETGRRTTTKAIHAINEDVKLNKALWGMAQYLADAV